VLPTLYTHSQHHGSSRYDREPVGHYQRLVAQGRLQADSLLLLFVLGIGGQVGLQAAPGLAATELLQGEDLIRIPPR
jgi:hypothetical protein